MPRFGISVHASRVLRRAAATGLALGAAGAVIAGVSPVVSAQSAPPKAYIGLFGDNTVGVLDTATNQVTKTIPIPTGPHGLVITPDNKWVYASSDGDSVVSVISTATDEVTTSIDVGTMPHGLAITPDGSRVLVAGFGTDQVEAIDTSTQQVTWKVPLPQPHNLAITADGQTVYAASQKAGSEAVAIIDIPSGTETGSVPLDHTPRALNVSPDQEEVVFTEAGVDALLVLDRASNQIVTQIPTGASPHHPLFTPDGKQGMVVAQGPGELDLFDPDTYTSTGTVKVGDMPHWIGASSDNHFAYVTNEKSNDISMVDLTTGALAATIPVGNAPRKIVMQSGSVPAPMGGTQAAPPAQPNAAPQVPVPAGAAPQGQPVDVNIAKFAFVPPTITISAGQSVTWTNTDPVAHTTTSDDKVWDSGDVSPNGTFSTTFAQPGTYAYHCTIHPFIRGTVVVN
jgi:YVTN family beta-propeller protein